MKHNKKATGKTLTKRNKKTKGKNSVKEHKNNSKQTAENTYMDLSFDRVFKAYFKDADEICISLLRQFLPLPKGSDIKSVKFLDSVLNPQNPEDKNSLLDLRVKLNTGASVNIEIQTVSKQHFKERILFYLSRLYSLGLEKGAKYNTLCPVYSLIFTKNFTMFKELKNYHSIFLLKSEEKPEVVFSDHLGIILVELDKFKEKPLANLIDKRDLWSYIIKGSKNLTDKELSVIETRGDDMKAAVQRLKMLSREKSMQIIEEAREKARRDRVAEIDYALDKGREEGMQKGRKKGREEGRITGMKEVALNLLKEHVDLNLIEKTTGLSKSEIETLKNIK